jgi:D-alanyl-D-alanine carboxypeptidase/D-alanyl-D-alanine-endopeptidase (penicillin-binding protein 4)
MLRLVGALVAVVAAASWSWSAEVAAEPPLQAAARSLLGEDQGVFVEAYDGTVLASQMADRPVHPASVTKVATSLALLERFGPRHRFETRMLAGGPVHDGRLAGDLVVEAGGDPTLVYENAFLMLRRLRELGVREVSGGLTVRGPLLFNWKPDPGGERLQLALAGRDGASAWSATRALLPLRDLVNLHDAGLAFAGTPATNGTSGRALVVNRSPPLVRIVKWLNDYSNNVFHLLSDRVGGPGVVQTCARARMPPALHGEVVIENAAGAGDVNRMSPRAAVAIMRALESELARNQLSITDALPVSGLDRGTLEHRLLDHRAMIVGKTGSFGDVGASALVGMVQTRRWGKVTFAMLNSWVPVPEARRRQDAFLRTLLDQGGGIPWSYRPPRAAPFTEATVE